MGIKNYPPGLAISQRRTKQSLPARRIKENSIYRMSKALSAFSTENNLRHFFRALVDLGFASRFNPELLILGQANLIAALDNNSSDANRRADSRAYRRADRTTGNRPDDQAGT